MEWESTHVDVPMTEMARMTAAYWARPGSGEGGAPVGGQDSRPRDFRQEARESARMK